MDLDIVKLKKAIVEIRKDLGEGFVATDVWSTTDTKSLIYNYASSNMYTWGMAPLGKLSDKGSRSNSGNPKMIALIKEVTHNLEKTIISAEYPGLGNYYLINLENNHVALVLKAGFYQLFLLVDLTKTTMGILMSVTLPKLLESLK